MERTGSARQSVSVTPDGTFDNNCHSRHCVPRKTQENRYSHTSRNWVLPQSTKDYVYCGRVGCFSDLSQEEKSGICRMSTGCGFVEGSVSCGRQGVGWQVERWKVKEHIRGSVDGKEQMYWTWRIKGMKACQMFKDVAVASSSWLARMDKIYRSAVRKVCLTFEITKCPWIWSFDQLKLVEIGWYVAGKAWRWQCQCQQLFCQSCQSLIPRELYWLKQNK